MRFNTPRPVRTRPNVLRLVPVLVLALLIGAGPASESAHAEGGKALDEYFAGRIVNMEKGRIKLRYDFSDVEQLKDFTDKAPWPVAQLKDHKMAIEGNRLMLSGNAAAKHKAIWRGAVTVTATVIPKSRQDIGGFMTPASLESDYLTFTLREVTFHRWDGSEGGQDSIIKFGEQWKEDEDEGFTGFRYMARKQPKEELVPGRPVKITFRLEKGKAYFTTPEDDLKAKELGNELKDFYVGLYVLAGKAWFDNVTIEGELDSRWMKEEDLEFRTVKPVLPMTGVDSETEELIPQHKAGKRRATAGLVRILMDPDRSDASYAAAVKALGSGPKRAIHQVVDLLYGPTPKVRRFGLEVLNELLGKSFGYKAKGSADERSKAIKKLYEALDKDPSLLAD